jgi:voltage-gated potassium channel
MNLYFRRVVYVLAAVAATLTVGTTGYVLVTGANPFDALYMAAITMTTVGYAETVPLGHAGRVFNVFYMILSASVLLLAIGLMTQTVIELQLSGLVARRRMSRMIEKLKGHYIVCGFGRVGRGAAAELKRAGAPVLVVDKREDRVEWAMRSGYLAVQGDSTSDETLKEARILEAAGLIAALSTDADNLFAVISAKTLNPGIRVSARAAEEEAERKMRQVGADSVFAPYTMAGTRLAQSLLKPHVHQFLDFATTGLGVDIRIEQVRVSPQSDIPGHSLAELRMRSEYKVIVLAIRREQGMEFNPPAEAVIRPGDYLIVMGEPEPLRRLEARVAGAQP